MKADEGVVTAHLRHLKVRNLRAQSISNRRYALRRLTEWADGPILYLTEAQLARWQDERTDRVKPATVRMELSAAREFYKWCNKQGLRTDDPTAVLDMPRVYSGTPRPMKDLSLARAIGTADPRVAAILGLAAFAGLRACEIARLDWSDVRIGGPDSLLLVMDGKGGKGRSLPVSGALVELLSALPARHGPVITQPNGHAGHCKPHRISQLANLFLHDEAHIEDTLHQCRHRFATVTYRACRDIRTVQELMGHSSPKTTAIYAQEAPDIARSAVETAGELDVA